MVPSAVRPASSGASEVFGNRALRNWVQDPATVNISFTEQLDADAGSAARTFLKFLNDRLVEVLGPEAVDPADGAATMLAFPPDWSDEHRQWLVGAVEQAGFPLVEIVPEPVAAAAPYVRDTDRPNHFLVIDWGSHGLDISVVESAPGAAPVVIDHVEEPIGGLWLDMVLETWLEERLSAELSDEDRRGLSLFARQFKEEASSSFAEGRSEHVQYCVLPAGAPPTRLTIAKDEMDKLFDEARTQFQTAVAEAPGRVGFRPEHFEQVIVAGGGARCYFTRDAVRAALGGSPVVSSHPEEAIARGLVLWGAK